MPCVACLQACGGRVAARDVEPIAWIMQKWINVLGSLLLVLLLFAVAQFVGVVAVQYAGIGLGSDGAMTDLGLMISYTVAMTLTLLMVSLYERLRFGECKRVDCSWRGFDPSSLLFGVVLLFALAVALSPLIGLLPADDRAFPRGGWTIFTVVVLAPIFEELIFRARLYAILHRYISPLGASLLAAITFGVVHLEAVVVVEAMLVGLVFSYLYVARRSIVASILLHSANNAMAYILMTTQYQGRDAMAHLADTEYFGLLYIVAVFYSLYGLGRVVRRLRNERLREVAEAFGSDDIEE